MIPSIPYCSALPPPVPESRSCLQSPGPLGLSRDFGKDMKHGSETVVRNIVQVDKGRAEKLSSQVLHSVKVLLHGRTRLPKDVETAREHHSQ